MPLNFVKFQRGTQAQYDRLKNAAGGSRLESDALYFVYDSTKPQDGGLLYLGEVLIGGTGSAAGVSNLSELSDVNLGSLVDGSILRYNLTSQTWESIAPGDLLPIVESGVTTGQEVYQNVLQRIDPTPMEGDIVFVDSTPYIYNGSSWQLLVGDELEGRVAALESGLAAVDGKIATAIAQANHLTYDVVQALPTITDDNVSSLSKTVFLVPNGDTTGDDRYVEYMLVNGQFEKLGNFGVDLNNYVTTTTFNTTVGDLQQAIAGLQNSLNDYVLVETYADEVGDISDLRTAVGDNDITLVEEVTELHDRLCWHPIEE